MTARRPPPRLPPMHALRAFEAAARHLSYSRAAAELHVTHGAVSHALRALEIEIGAPLFRRTGNAMLLTDPGQRLAARVREALAALALGLEEARANGDGARTVTVSVLPAFAARWLVPRLARFHAAHPTVDVALRATQALADLARDGVDLAIRYGPGRWPGTEAEKLMDEEVFPVCSPAFLAARPLRTPADLLGVPLLRDLRQPWADWFRMAGLADAAEPTHGPTFDDAGLLVGAAAAGQGVALARGELVREEIATGRLVRLFERSARADFAYFIVRPARRPLAPGAEAFAIWLRREAGDMAVAGERDPPTR